MFSGEVNLLSGRRLLTQIRGSETGEVIEIDREQLLKLVQTDSEMSDIFMRAFILRRIGLIEQGLGDVVLIGSNNCSDTLRIREFLTRNNHPYSSIDLDEADTAPRRVLFASILISRLLSVSMKTVRTSPPLSVTLNL